MPPRASMEGSLAKRFRSKGNTTLSTPRKGNQLPVSPSSTRHNEEPDIAAPFRQKLDEAWGKDRWGPPASYRPPKDPPLSPRGICLTFSTEDLARLHEITILAQQHQTPLKDLYEKGGLLYLAALKDGSPRWSPGLPGRALQMFREHVIDLTPSSQPPPENPCSESIEEKAFVQLRKRSPLTGDVVSHLGRRCPTGTPSNVEILDPSFFQSPSLSHRKQLNKDLTYCVANDESYFTLLCMRLDRQSNTIFIGHYDPTKDFPRYNSFMNRVRNWIGKACHGWCYKFEFIAGPEHRDPSSSGVCSVLALYHLLAGNAGLPPSEWSKNGKQVHEVLLETFNNSRSCSSSFSQAPGPTSQYPRTTSRGSGFLEGPCGRPLTFSTIGETTTRSPTSNPDSSHVQTSNVAVTSPTSPKPNKPTSPKRQLESESCQVYEYGDIASPGNKKARFEFGDHEFALKSIKYFNEWALECRRLESQRYPSREVITEKTEAAHMSKNRVEKSLSESRRNRASHEERKKDLEKEIADKTKLEKKLEGLVKFAGNGEQPPGFSQTLNDLQESLNATKVDKGKLEVSKQDTESQIKATGEECKSQEHQLEQTELKLGQLKGWERVWDELQGRPKNDNDIEKT